MPTTRQVGLADCTAFSATNAANMLFLLAYAPVKRIMHCYRETFASTIGKCFLIISIDRPSTSVSAIGRQRDRCESSMNFQPAAKVCLF